MNLTNRQVKNVLKAITRYQYAINYKDNSDLIKFSCLATLVELNLEQRNTLKNTFSKVDLFYKRLKQNGIDSRQIILESARWVVFNKNTPEIEILWKKHAGDLPLIWKNVS